MELASLSLVVLTLMSPDVMVVYLALPPALVLFDLDMVVERLALTPLDVMVVYVLGSMSLDTTFQVLLGVTVVYGAWRPLVVLVDVMALDLNMVVVRRLVVLVIPSLLHCLQCKG